MQTKRCKCKRCVKMNYIQYRGVGLSGYATIVTCEKFPAGGIKPDYCKDYQTKIKGERQ